MGTSNARILVVDDDPGIREYLTSRLAVEGYRICEASCADEAKKVLTENPDIDLILLDVIMPGISGFDLLRDLKADSRYIDIPVIMVTALGLVEDKELAFRLGAGDYLTKPFDTREMLARIRTHISLKKKSDEISRSNQILSTILSTVPGIVYMKDADRNIIHVNQTFEEVCGKSSDEIIGKNEDALFDEDISQMFHRSDDLIFSYGIPYLENVEKIPHVSGEMRSYFFRRKPVTNKNGTISGLVGVGVDLTDQIVLHSILSEREAYLSTLINTFQARIWAIDKEGYFTQQNSTHVAKWGYFIGQTIDDIPIDEKIKNFWKNDFLTALAGENINKIYPSRSGETSVAVVRWINPIISNDEIIGVLGIAFDVSKDSIQKLNQILTDKNFREK